MSETTYEVWHFDGKRPELLSGGHPDKGVCRRVWRNSQHAAIVRDGVVLEPKPSCDGRRARAIASAAGEAHRAATGLAPEMAPRGVPSSEGKRLAESSNPALRALDAAPPMPPEELIPEVEVRALPAGVELDPPVVIRRKTQPPPAPKESTVPIQCCPCGQPSAPTAEGRQGGRPSVPEFADLCLRDRTAAMNRRRRTGESAASARAWALTPAAERPAPVVVAVSRKSAPKPVRPSKPARTPAPKPPPVAAAEAPVPDLVAVVRRQRAVVDALGGIDQAERVAAACARAGGPASLVALVEELAR